MKVTPTNSYLLQDTFPCRFLYLRNKKQMTQRQLAKDISISHSTISRWESGETEPTASYLCYIANYFNVTTDFLLGREPIV